MEERMLERGNREIFQESSRQLQWTLEMLALQFSDDNKSMVAQLSGKGRQTR